MGSILERIEFEDAFSLAEQQTKKSSNGKLESCII
jgi:hypothetical protein